ncbi:hypothetical protein PVAP13_5NG028800 [Panicum virgatum]|uniref:Uncharacterized protein n=1 Tax=Panicum virgatum TaxID=38727 RepID=A0A8T0RM06_PANVG|nr:hypothetical protein PVAP13_5NG028800 [Panicum virgatum]
MERGQGERRCGGGGAPLQVSLAFALRSGGAPLRPPKLGASRGRLQAPTAAHGCVDHRPSAPTASVRGATAVFSSIGAGSGAQLEAAARAKGAHGGAQWWGGRRSLDGGHNCSTRGGRR